MSLHTPASRSMPRRLVVLVAFLTVLAVALPGGSRVRADAAEGRVLYVAPWGDDYAEDGYSTPENTFQRPWRTISMTIRRARPGDTIVVRGGTYREAAGWGLEPATAKAPTRLTNYKDERVVLKGHLQLENADYWTVDGINVTYDPKLGRTESLVKFDGGTGWSFVNSEVWGTRGVSNLMIHTGRFGDAHDFRVANNCIHSNEAVGDPFMNDHNIYLYPGLGSRGGVIERNIVYDAPNGANIKAGGPNEHIGAASVSIRFNTLAYAVAAVTVPYKSHDVAIERNLLVFQRGGTKSYNAAVIGNHTSGAANLAVRNGVSGFPKSVRSTQDSANPVQSSDNRWVTPEFGTTGTCSGFVPSDPMAGHYGKYASAAQLPGDEAPSSSFEDTRGSVFADDIQWIADAGITRGCNPPGNTRFCPDQTVTRGQMAAFLHRAIG